MLHSCQLHVAENQNLYYMEVPCSSDNNAVRGMDNNACRYSV